MSIMLYRLIAYLFHDDDIYRYTAKPWHIVYPMLMLAVGSVTFGYGWFFFGLVMSMLGIALGISITFAISWDKSIEYWSMLNEFARTMIKSNNPDLWEAMGFKHPPHQIMITETKQADNESGFSMKFHRLPISPAVMQSVADKVLMSGRGEFPAENSHLGKNIPNYRKVKKYLKENRYIIPTNPKNERLGYSFNRKGLDALYEYASESIKLELKRKGDNNGRQEN